MTISGKQLSLYGGIAYLLISVLVAGSLWHTCLNDSWGGLVASIVAGLCWPLLVVAFFWFRW
mgnify:CR=1